MTANVKPAKRFARGDFRRRSVELVEANLSLPLDEIVAIIAESFEMELPAARTHVRWLVREGFVNDPKGYIKSWPKRAPRKRAESTDKNKPVRDETSQAKASTETRAEPGGGSGGVPLAPSTAAGASKPDTKALIALIAKRRAEAQQAQSA